MISSQARTIGGMALAAGGALALAAPAPAVFKQPRTFPVGDFPVAVAAGDLDRDGNRDLVTANADGANGTVLFGNGNGGFPRERTLNIGDQFGSTVAIGRFDGDRYPDIALGRVTMDVKKASVVIFKTRPRDGGGVRFRRGKSNPLGAGAIVGPSPVDMDAADIDRDGRLDLVVVDRTFDVVSFLRGRRNARFAPEEEHPVGDAPQALAIGRVNAGKRLDVLTANLPADSVSLLTGKGGVPRFDPAQTFPASNGPFSIAAGNVSGDGATDFVVNSDVDAEVQVFNNIGAGFVPLPPVALPDEASQVAIGRIAGDPQPDIAMMVRGVPPKLRLLVRRPNGTLALKAKGYTVEIDAANSALELTRIDGDGKRDVVLSGGSAGVVAVLLHR